MANDKKLTVDFDENVLFYEIEDNDEFDFDELTEEEIEKIDNANDEKLAEISQHLVDTTLSICNCSKKAFHDRQMSRQAIFGAAAQAELTQGDLDSYKYALVVNSKNGLYSEIDAIVQECKKCHRIKYWGRVEIFGQLLAESTTNVINGKKARAKFEEEQKAKELEEVEVVDEVIVDDEETATETEVEVIDSADDVTSLFGPGTELVDIGEDTSEDTPTEEE